MRINPLTYGVEALRALLYPDVPTETSLAASMATLVLFSLFMNVKLKNGKPASEESILTLESALGFRLSGSFVNFIREHNGAEPEDNIFRICDDNDGGVNQFIAVQEILIERAQIENLPVNAYPVAWAEGGNYVFIDEDQDGAVFLGP